MDSVNKSSTPKKERNRLRWLLYFLIFFFILTGAVWWAWINVIDLGESIPGLTKVISEDYIFYYPTNWNKQENDPLSLLLYTKKDRTTASTARLRLSVSEQDDKLIKDEESCQEEGEARKLSFQQLYQLPVEAVELKKAEFIDDNSYNSCWLEYSVSSEDESFTLSQRIVNHSSEEKHYEVTALYFSEDEGKILKKAQDSFVWR